MKRFISFVRFQSKKMHGIDYIILACIVLLIGVFLFLRMSKRTEFITVLVKIQPGQIWSEANPAPWYTQSLSGHPDAYNSFGEKIATIHQVQSFNTSDGKNEIISEVQLKVLYDPLRHQYQYNYQPVLIGKPIDIPFTQFSLIGMVIGINTKLTYSEKNIELRLSAIHPWKIQELVKGLKAVDMAGNTIAEINDITIANAQVYQFDDIYGRPNIIQSEDLTRKDVIMKLRIRVVRYNDTFYSVYGSPIKIGSVLNIEFPTTTVGFAEISAIYD